MTVRELRYKNMREIARELGAEIGDASEDSRGGQARLAELMEKESSYISQIIGKNPTKGIGNKTARLAEKAANKPEGWLDKDHDAAILNRDLILILNEHIDERYPKTSAKERTEVLGDMYYEAAGASMEPGSLKFAIDMWFKARKKK